MIPRRHLPVLLVLLCFNVLGVVSYRHTPGEDLSSSYVGCRVLAEHQDSHLYDHDDAWFSLQDEPVWVAIGKAHGFAPVESLHPYVQTPLWAWSLRPLCTHVEYPAFNLLFLMLFMLCVSGTLWLTARYWTETLFHPGWMVVLCVALYVSEPFRYAAFLNQTHMIFILLTVAALILAPREHPIWAGILLALAASVKITPGFLVIYWLITRQWKAAISFIVTSAALVGVTLLAVGPTLFHDYLTEMRQLSNVLLLAFNNQSLAAFLLRHSHPTHYFIWYTYKLPKAMKTALTFLCLLTPLLGGLLDRRRGSLAHTPPYGAIFTLIAATICTPIAWTHYFLILMMPVMLLLDGTITGRFRLAPVFFVPIYLLNVAPITFRTVGEQVHWFSIAYSPFFSAVLALVALSLLSCRSNGAATPRRAERRAGALQSTPA